VALLYAGAKLRNGESAEAAALLEPFAASEGDVAFLNTFADALRQAGQLDRARSILERCCARKMKALRGCSISPTPIPILGRTTNRWKSCRR